MTPVGAASLLVLTSLSSTSRIVTPIRLAPLVKTCTALGVITFVDCACAGGRIAAPIPAAATSATAAAAHFHAFISINLRFVSGSNSRSPGPTSSSPAEPCRTGQNPENPVERARTFRKVRRGPLAKGCALGGAPDNPGLLTVQSACKGTIRLHDPDFDCHSGYNPAHCSPGHGPAS